MTEPIHSANNDQINISIIFKYVTAFTSFPKCSYRGVFTIPILRWPGESIENNIMRSCLLCAASYGKAPIV